MPPCGLSVGISSSRWPKSLTSRSGLSALNKLRLDPRRPGAHRRNRAWRIGRLPNRPAALARTKIGYKLRCDFVGTGLSGLALWLFGGDIPEGEMEPLTIVVSFLAVQFVDGRQKFLAQLSCLRIKLPFELAKLRFVPVARLAKPHDLGAGVISFQAGVRLPCRQTPATPRRRVPKEQ
jgi:hypothetical protein